VPDPLNSQAFNRYMMCLGNPISYADVNGFQASTSPTYSGTVTTVNGGVAPAAGTMGAPSISAPAAASAPSAPSAPSTSPGATSPGGESADGGTQGGGDQGGGGGFRGEGYSDTGRSQYLSATLYNPRGNENRVSNNEISYLKISKESIEHAGDVLAYTGNAAGAVAFACVFVNPGAVVPCMVLGGAADLGALGCYLYVGSPKAGGAIVSVGLDTVSLFIPNPVKCANLYNNYRMTKAGAAIGIPGVLNGVRQAVGIKGTIKAGRYVTNVEGKSILGIFGAPFAAYNFWGLYQ